MWQMRCFKSCAWSATALTLCQRHQRRWQLPSSACGLQGLPAKSCRQRTAVPSAELKCQLNNFPGIVAMSVRPSAWWLKVHLDLQDELKDDDPVDMLGAAGAAPVKRKHGARSDIQKAAVCALARQGAVAAGLAATSTKVP